MKLSTLIVVGVVTLAAGSVPGTSVGSSPAASTAEHEPGAVVYGIGVSTDPYVDSHPRGVGVATGLEEGRLRRSEVRDPSLGYFGLVQWIAPGRIAVGRFGPPFRPPLLLSFWAGRLTRLGPAPLRPLEPVGSWSPSASLIATEPIAHCPSGDPQELKQCYRSGGVVYVARADGSARRRVGRGHVGGWTPDGRLLLTDDRGVEYVAVELGTGGRQAVIPLLGLARFAQVRRVGVGRPVWSADRRYIAALAGVAWPKRRRIVGTTVIARSDGRVVRLITSRYTISMIAWSPRGHRLAWTTSGFPDPHELFTLDEPAGKPRKLFGTSNRHFDWITWSPDNRFLLLDDAKAGADPKRRARQSAGAWRLIDTIDPRTVRLFPRLGGAPLWCCPVNSYVTLNG